MKMKTMRLNADMRALVDRLNENYKFTNEPKYGDASHTGRYFLVNAITHKTLFSWKTQREAYKDMTENCLALPYLPSLFD